MGASRSIIKRIFLYEGAIVAFSGALVGLILGFTICWLQKVYGFVSMGIVGSLVDAYPVEMRFNDFFFTAIVVIIMTLAASYFPAKRAVKF
ncbi:FtsX-like permease family protein [Flectobacillus sp. BAB-3569]|uniref:FtsX-like permease family protein n=1 Tax=Flectobacillus sp. BAB-3569 TaxID=1509483 RepID=UPI00268FBE7C|nr:FtsX-like permease family protein [Flectobacillus sp. BAB-3569]